MKFTFAVLTALVAPLVAQNTTPAPTMTSGDWFDNVPGWAYSDWSKWESIHHSLISSDAAKWTSIYNSLVSAGKIPPTLTAAPWPVGSFGPGQGPWGPGGFHGSGGGRHWGGPDGPGPWGPDNWGPFSDWSTRSDWRNGPWTAWWDGDKCPPSDWPGWTAGPWSTAPPWTSWKACTAMTTATSVVTTTISGVVATSTAYELQVAAASDPTSSSSNSSGSGSGSGSGNQGSAGGRVTAGIGAVLGAAVLGLAVGL